MGFDRLIGPRDSHLWLLLVEGNSFTSSRGMLAFIYPPEIFLEFKLSPFLIFGLLFGVLETEVSFDPYRNIPFW